jgi:hypothetical protein
MKNSKTLGILDVEISFGREELTHFPFLCIAPFFGSSRKEYERFIELFRVTNNKSMSIQCGGV